MTLYIYPPLGNITITPAPGTDFATETTLQAVDAKLGDIQTAVEASQDAIEDRLSGSLVPAAYDTIIPSVTATEDIYEYRLGGLLGTVVKTLTVTYTDATKATIQSIVAV